MQYFDSLVISQKLHVSWPTLTNLLLTTYRRFPGGSHSCWVGFSHLKMKSQVTRRSFLSFCFCFLLLLFFFFYVDKKRTTSLYHAFGYILGGNEFKPNSKTKFLTMLFSLCSWQLGIEKLGLINLQATNFDTSIRAKNTWKVTSWGGQKKGLGMDSKQKRRWQWIVINVDLKAINTPVRYSMTDN